MAHYARHALEPMPDPAAGAALRDAMGKLQGSLLVGVVNSIGFRRDAAATGALAALLANADAEIVTAAAAALGRIGSVEAAKQLQGALTKAAGAQRTALADASLTCAENLVTARKNQDAVPIFDRLAAAEFPAHIRTAAMGGAIMARQDAGIPLLVQQLKGQDQAMLAAAWRAARELPGAKATKALAAELASFPAAKQVLLLEVLGDRGDQGALPPVLATATKGDPKVRLAALQALPRVDDGQASLPVLLQTATQSKIPEEVAAAIAGLIQIGGAETNARILAALPSAGVPLRAKLIGVLGARKAANARGELLKLAASTEPEISKASLRALAVVAQPADLPELIRLSITSQDDAVKVPADLAIFGVSMKINPAAQRAEPVLKAFRQATDGKTKCALLRPLGAIIKATGGTPDAFAAVTAAFKDPDAQVRNTALRTLADWPDASPAALLLDIIKNDPDPAHRELALRGGTRMVASVAAGRDATKLDYLAWFTQANQSVRTVEDKMAIVSGLGSLKQVEGLQMLQPYLKDPAVQTEAELAVLDIAPALANTSSAGSVKTMLGEISTSTKDPDVRRRASKMAKTIPAKKQK
jgi:hypothetical protein